jgi:hypothetical protein
MEINQSKEQMIDTEYYRPRRKQRRRLARKGSVLRSFKAPPSLPPSSSSSSPPPPTIAEEPLLHLPPLTVQPGSVTFAASPVEDQQEEEEVKEVKEEVKKEEGKEGLLSSLLSEWNLEREILGQREGEGEEIASYLLSNSQLNRLILLHKLSRRKQTEGEGKKERSGLLLFDFYKVALLFLFPFFSSLPKLSSIHP